MSILAIVLTEATPLTITIGCAVAIIYGVIRFVNKLSRIELQHEINTTKIEVMEKKLETMHDIQLKCPNCPKG